jgi:hypothetical protein
MEAGLIMAFDRSQIPEELREALASYAHQTWSGWMQYLFEKSHWNHDGTVTIPRWAVERWRRQSDTNYADLPKNEKESDREEADRMLILMLEYGSCLAAK